MDETQTEDTLIAALLRVSRLGWQQGTDLARQVDRALVALQHELRPWLFQHDPGQALSRRQTAGLLAWLLDHFHAAIQRTYGALEALMARVCLALALDQAERVAAQAQLAWDAVAATALLILALRRTPFPSARVGTQPSALAEEWWQRQGVVFAQRLDDQMRAGVLAGESPAELARRITGTPALRGKDGLMAAARRTAASVAESQAAMALTQGTEAVVAANPGRIVALVHVSTLDDRTSAICQARDGKRFDPVTYAPLGHTLPYLSGPPYHPSCRSYIALEVRP